MKNRHCPYCQSQITGRTNKKFCTVHCKGLYHYYKDRDNPTSYLTIQIYLKRNREILKSNVRRGKTFLNFKVLKEQGFKEVFFTHQVKLNDSRLVIFYFEYGCIFETDEKVILMVWQDYMKYKMIRPNQK